MGKELVVGIIGCGGIATQKHLPSLAQIPELKIVGFCDIVKQRAQDAAKEYGAPGAKVYTDYKEMLKDASIQAVYVLTPNKSHSFITIDALESGRHVMCEKPMAKTYAEAKAMCDAAKRTGKILTIGYQNRYRADSEYLKAMCEGGELGDIYYAKAHAVRRRAVPTWGVFLNKEEQGGGPLIDIGTHALDLTMWCMGNYSPKLVVGTTYQKLNKQTQTANKFGEWNPEEFDVEDSAFGFVVMQDGATITLDASWALNTLDVREAKTTLCGTKAGADMKDDLYINCVKHNRLVEEIPDMGSGNVAFFDVKEETPALKEAKVFVSAVLNGTPLTVLPEQALAVTQILEAMYESARTGKAIELQK